MITKRPRRLAGVTYVGYQRYFLTICTAFRRRVFVDAGAVDPVLAQLTQCAALFEFAVVAYCFMPDHLHVLLRGESERADLQAFVKRFKQLSGYGYAQAHTGAKLWQPGYHERILRDDEATDAIVRYVLENPVRAALASELGTYVFAGSAVYTIDELSTAYEEQT